MVSVNLFSVFLMVATPVVTGLPSNDGKVIETVVFKRDNSALTPRDLELAEMHGVDLQEMWKHSVVKRSDGDDYTIWVHNSFVEDTGVKVTDDSGIHKRLLKILSWDRFQYWRELLGTGIACDFKTYNDDTGPNAPFTGGIQTMRDWAGRTLGDWNVNTPSRANGVWISLVVAGSNSGFNAIFQVSPPQARRANPDERVGAWIAAFDISVLARETNSRYARQIGNSWRARGWGTMECSPHADDMIPWDPSKIGPDYLTYWRITNTAEWIDPKAGTPGRV